MSPESEQLKAARDSGSLTNVIGALREEARRETANASTPAREQLGLEDATIRVAAGLAGKKGAERRQVMSDVQVGKTVTAQGVAKIVLTRAEKITKAQAWAQGLTQEQRDEFVVSEKFYALPDTAAEIISEVFATLEDRAYEDSIGIANFDFDSETPDADAIVGDEDDGESEADDFEAMFEQAAWEAEAT